ncbi:MAG: caspase family protein [Nitrospirae bacterium]|nr:caspase family protein [Nitrospirota bacterium]MCL5977213.1 caspase family protein [Nitrospirota bacterium]
MKRLAVHILILAAIIIVSGPVSAEYSPSSFHEAAQKGDIKRVTEFLNAGTDVNQKDSYGWTPLQYAAVGENGKIDKNIDTVRLLIDRGAHVNVGWGHSPLYGAAFRGHVNVARLLIEKGADTDRAMAELEADGRPYAQSGLRILKILKAQKGSKPVTPSITKEVSPSVIVIKSDVDELPAVKAKPNKNSYAIVIGIESYRQKLPKADFATADAKTMTEYLTKVMGYPEENVVTLLNDKASMSDLTKYFEKWLSNNVEKDSTVFVYYSGHGAPNPKTGDAYLVPFDGDPSFIAETGYSLKRLYDNLGKLQAKEIIVALDSCFSGAGGRSVIAKGARPLVMAMESLQIPQKIAVLSAASADQISSTYEDKGHGLFTYFMLKGIKGEGDANNDGKIEIEELFEYIKPNVEKIARKNYNNEQSPQIIVPKEKQRIFLKE